MIFRNLGPLAYAVMLFTSCAQGSPSDWSGSGGVQEAPSLTSSSSAGSGGQGAGGSDSGDLGGFGGSSPDEASDDEAVLYSVDQMFWQLYQEVVQQNVNASISTLVQGYRGSGQAIVNGLVDTDTTGHLLISFHVDFDQYVRPNPRLEMNFTYTGPLDVSGSLDGGLWWGNNVVFLSSGLDLTGQVKYEDGHVSDIDETCSVSFVDDFREPEDLGGLTGQVCDRPTRVSEVDVWE